jgi:hypothetical protein
MKGSIIHHYSLQEQNEDTDQPEAEAEAEAEGIPTPPLLCRK